MLGVKWLVFMALTLCVYGEMEEMVPPSCALQCWENTKYVSKCGTDEACLCNEAKFQNSVYQCIYAQCDTAHFGFALHHSILKCSAIINELVVGMIPVPDHDSLRRRELDYLAGPQFEASGSAMESPTGSAGYPSNSVGYLTQSAGTPCFTNVQMTESSFTLNAAALFTTTHTTVSVIPTSAGDESSSGIVFFTGAALDTDPVIAVPIMITLTALYFAL
ncbi:hypothetical protein BP5796_10343 [Coleophoma crateriformis]|uniref:CFEM domain-containing protein n=1 Tax=Coleophoma crateriformis TaxID=565419 RepID=A0A3D8QQ47_9HELO|nr:hypothetical protein BP5796_10343 [Coleophoma crateriformis]